MKSPRLFQALFCILAGVVSIEAFVGVHAPASPRQQAQKQSHQYAPIVLAAASKQEMGNAWPSQLKQLNKFQPTTTRGKVLIRAYTVLRFAFLYKMLKFPFWDAFLVYCYSNAHTVPDVKRVEASKLAIEKSTMLSGETGKLEASSESRKWRFLVWQRIVLQGYGLFRVLLSKNADQLFPSLSIILLSRFVFSLLGGESHLYHDADGKLKPRTSPVIQQHRTKMLVQSIVLAMAPSWDISGTWKALLVVTALDAVANNQPPVVEATTAGSANFADLMEQIMKNAELQNAVQPKKSILMSDDDKDVKFPETMDDDI